MNKKFLESRKDSESIEKERNISEAETQDEKKL